MKVALLGDYDRTVTAHRAIPQAIDLSARALSTTIESIWIRISEVVPEMLSDQPERSALKHTVHPLIATFLAAGL